MTPTTVGFVLVEGQDADGATMERDAFAVHTDGRTDALHTSKQAAAAVRRTKALAAARGHRLHSIGVTWSDDAGAEASLLLESLSDSGFDNVVPVRLPEATDALARGIAEVTGYEITAVCVIEPETVMVLVVNDRDGAVQTALNHAIADNEDLIGWLCAVFARVEWAPEALVVVGSAGGLGDTMPELEEALAVPVFAPAEAELALARGAALASTQNAEFSFADVGDELAESPDSRRRLSHVRALTMLVAAGVVTFVVSGSLAIGLQLTSRDTPAPTEQRQIAETPASAAAVHPAPAFPPPLSVPAAPPPEELPAPIDEMPLAPPPAEPVDPPVVVAPDVAMPAEEPPADLPVAEPVAPLPPEPVAPPPLLPPPPIQQPVPAPLVQAPPERPGILSRIKDKLSGIGRDDGPPPVPVLAPPDQPPLLPPP